MILKNVKKLFIYIVIFLATILVFNILLILTYLIPRSLIYNNIIESAKLLTKQGIFYYFDDIQHYHLNNATDSLMINMAYSADPKDVVYSYMSGRKNYDSKITKAEINEQTGELFSIGLKDYDPIKEFNNFLNGDITASVTYQRYWHGNQVMLRLLLILFNIDEIRILRIICLHILLIITMILIYKKIGIRYMIIYLYSFLAIDYFYVGLSLESSPIFLLTNIVSILFLLNLKRLNKNNMGKIFFLIGMIVNFIDFLTVPIISLAIPLLIYILYLQESKTYDLKESIKLIINCSIKWAFGYALTWISKWIIYDCLFNENTILAGIKQGIYRTTSKDLVSYKLAIAVIKAIFSDYYEIIYLFFLTELIYVYIQICLIKKKYVLKKPKKYISEIIPFLLISCMPIAWYCVLFNHSFFHYFYTYRGLMVVYLVIFISVIKILDKKED